MQTDHITERKLQDIHFSVFASVTDLKSIDARAATWPELVELIKTPKAHASKRACPLIKLAAFADRPNNNGNLRHDANVEQVYGIEGDYDGELITPTEGAARLRAAGVRAIIYTSASHCVMAPPKSNGGPRWRVLAPLSGPAAPAQRAELASLLNGALGGILAGESWVLSQTYYFGAVKDVAYEVHVVDGEPLDVVAYAPSFDPIGPPVSIRESHRPVTARRRQDADNEEIEFLDAAGWLTSGDRDDGAVNVRCPRGELHGTDTGPSSTTYFPAGVGGRDEGGFECRHQSCGKPTTTEFWHASGLWALQLAKIRDEFEVITLDAKQQADAAIARAGNAEKAARVELDDFFAYGPDHKFIYRPTRAMWPAASVDGMVSPWPEVGDKPMAPSRWLDRNRAVQQMSWLPGEPELIKDLVVLESGFASRAGARVFNRYVPPAPYTGDAALAGPWLDHLKLIYPDDWSHLLHWFAHRVQRPGEKVNHALVLGGTQGIGKDSVLVPVKVGVGACNVQDIAPGALLGSFNGFVASVLLVVSEARDLGDSDRFKLYEHCKTLTAAPPDVLRVNEKHLREYYVPNLVGVIFTTNHRTSGLYLPAEDRRHYVAWSEATPAQLGADYFKRLYGWYEAGGVGHVLAYLHALDLSRFNAKAEPPKTEAFWALVHAGESPESNELRDAINACGLPAAVTVRMVREAALRVGLDDLAAQLFDPKTRARLPHMFERVGYVAVRNPDSKADGRFGKETVYADAKLTRSAQILAARRIPPPTKAQKTAGSTALDFA